MTTDDDKPWAEVEVANAWLDGPPALTFRVRPRDADGFSAGSSIVDLEIDVQSREPETVIHLRDLSLDGEECEKLIDALTTALAEADRIAEENPESPIIITSGRTGDDA